MKHQEQMVNKRHKGSSFEAISELPFDTIIEILSWLPVESLLRYKCVCKRWYSLIQDDGFILKHFDWSSPTDHLSHTDSKNFKFISTDGGLFMERSLSNSRVFRIRNPAAQQVLYLPDAPDNTSTMDFAFNPYTRECKVVCICWEENEVHSTEPCLKVITVGKDEQWRTLILPNQTVMNARGEYVSKAYFSGVLKAQGVAHLTQIVRVIGPDYYIQVQSLDVWRECFCTTTLPEGVFQDLTKVLCYIWNGCTAVADVVEQTVHFLAVEDFEEHKWSKNEIKIPLKAFKDCPPHSRGQTGSTGVLSGVSNDFTYDQKRGTLLGTYGEKLYKPSLMTLKGMISE